MNMRTAAAPMTAVAIQPTIMIDRLAVKAPITDFLETRRMITHRDKLLATAAAPRQGRCGSVPSRRSAAYIIAANASLRGSYQDPLTTGCVAADRPSSEFLEPSATHL